MGKRMIVRTGIDIGAANVKFVRCEGEERMEACTHVGLRTLADMEGETAEAKAGNAVKEILAELGLGRNQLGQVITCVGAARSAVREVMMPPLTDEEFALTLPFEARKYLNLDDAEELVVDGCVLEREAGAEGEGGTLVLMAASERSARDYPVRVLDRAGLEPEVVDVEPLALMRSLNTGADMRENDPAHAMVNLGHDGAYIVITYRGAGLLHRTLWQGATPEDDAGQQEWIREVAGRTLETLTFYRGRYRREVEVIHLVGGGALAPGRCEALAKVVNRDVVPGRPLSRFAREAKGYQENKDREAVFETACGLCRWGDA